MEYDRTLETSISGHATYAATDAETHPAQSAADEPAGRPIPNNPAALLYPAEAAHLLCVSHRTLEAYRLRGGGPPYIALGRRCVRYRRADLMTWIEARRRRHTSDPGACSAEGA